MINQPVHQKSRRTDSRLVALTVRGYERLLAAYPPVFRAAFGAELVQLVRDDCRAAEMSGGANAVLRRWPVLGIDLLITAGRERLAAHERTFTVTMTSHDKHALLIAAVFALAVGYLNLHTDETGLLVGIVLLSAMSLSFARPRLFWLWALVVGLSVPAGAAIALANGWHLPYPNTWPNVQTSFIALVPAFVGALAGHLVGWNAQRLHRPVEP